MGIDSWSLLSRLKRAVKKVKFLLHLDIHRWRLVASMIGASSATRHRQLSFNERPGLRACCSDYDTESEDSTSGFSMGLRRTISYPSEDDIDIDKRAGIFIENFHRQLQIERQISLELKYLQANKSFKLLSP